MLDQCCQWKWDKGPGRGGGRSALLKWRCDRAVLAWRGMYPAPSCEWTGLQGWVEEEDKGSF